MKIARVKLAGFKSFVDPCELRIMPGLTGVVGPNGCGKSNLLEAIRWVMGEGSPKSLRGSAMDDVIFAGTASRPQRQFAEVSILAERDDDEVEVVRRIERGAGSAYRINGRDARARDAQLIFADAATGAHSPALVSQGRIGAIIAAKPAERRQMLEEAAGISGLHVRRREAEIRLKATETNLGRVEEMVAEQEARVAVLRRQARSAERYRKLSDDVRTAEGRLIYARWRDAAAAAQEARAEAKAADETVFAASEAQRVAAALSNAAMGSLATARAAAQTARDDAAEARHRLATVEAERVAVEARIAAIASQSEQLTTDHAREGELARDADEALTRLAAEADTLDDAIAAATSERPALAEAVAAAEEQSRAAEVALAQALAEAAREAAERRVAEAALAAATLRLDRATAAQGRAKADLAALGDVATIEAARDAAMKARLSAQAEADASLATIECAEQARTAAVELRAKAETDASTAAAALASIDAEARALERDLANATGALSQVRAAPGYEVALAAALADDLNAEIGDAGPRRWTGAAIGAGDPPLPVGDPLGAHVAAPPQLARRLAQIAVVEADDGTALAVGQRLVTLDGKLRRWDGFASNGAGAAAAEGLKRRNRLSAIERKLPAVRVAAATATQIRNSAVSALAEAGQTLEAARVTRNAADAALRAALRAEDQAGLALDRVTVQTAELNDRLAHADAEMKTADTEYGAAATTLAMLPAGPGNGVTMALDRAAQEARDAITGLRTDLAARDGRAAADKGRRVAVLAEAEDWRARSGKAGKRVEDMAKRAAALEIEAASLANAPAQVNARAAMIGIEAARLADTAAAAVDAERAAEAALRDREGAAAMAGETLATARETRAGAQARTENQELRRVEMGRVAGERFECPAALLPEKLAFDAASVGAAGDESARLERAAMERERLGPVNLVAESELAELEAGRQSNAADIAELTEAVHRLRGSIGSLNREGRTRLRAAFEAVNGHFRTLFGTLFNGGEAHLALIDSDDPLEAGLEIMAQPPGKKLSSLTLLSGGEQALTAVALIFALFLTNPAPLCVLDEVDAPLDDANVERFCDLLDAMTRDTDTRYLIVTHNAVTMARMHRLYGVTMIEQGISRLVSVDLGGAEALLAAE
jgi:chromosome segregation protein